MFTERERERAQERLVAMAERDHRIVAAALIGGSAVETIDRWSDIDLGFGVAAGVPVADVIADWTELLEGELRAVHLFDLPFLSSLYRVFLLPGGLQVDLSFTPAGDFGALGPRFKLLFGDSVERTQPGQQPAAQAFGLAVHHALRARLSIERGRLWQSEYWISGVRDEAFGLASRRLGLESSHGRGFDQLPAELREAAEAALVRSIEPGELLRALGAAVSLLLGEREAAPDLAAAVEALLEELAADRPPT